MSTSVPPPASRRMSAGTLGALVAVGTLLVVAATGGVGAWLYVERPWLERGSPDEVLELEYPTPIAEVDPLLDDGEVDVALPIGAYTLYLAAAPRLGEADLADDTGSDDRAAPDGQEYLTVGWSYRLTPRRGSDIGSLISDRPEDDPRSLPSPYLTVRDAATGDVLGPDRLFESAEEQPEPFPDDVPDAVAIAVPEGVDVVVDVTFDGLVQRINGTSGEIDAGLAAPYYGPMAEDLEADPTERIETDARTSPRECSVRLEVPRSVTTTAPTCEIEDVAMAPWTRELGWVSEPDQQWLAVLLDVDTDFAADRGIEGLVVRPGGRPEVTLDGRGPDAERRVDEVYLEPDPSWSPATWATDPGDAGALRAEVPLRMTRADPRAPALRGRVVVTADVLPTDEEP